MEKTKEEFIVFIRQAINDRKSEAFVELYQFLVSLPYKYFYTYMLVS